MPDPPAIEVSALRKVYISAKKEPGLGGAMKSLFKSSEKTRSGKR